MSEADKIIKSLRDSGKKVEEFYMSNKTSDKNVANIENRKQVNTSLGFSIDLERTLNYLAEHNAYFAQIGKTKIRYIGEEEDTTNGKRQVFEIERQVD